jgi:tetratricopeptide (TPR) repeat protein
MGLFNNLFGKKKNTLEDLDKKNDDFIAKNPVAKDTENEMMRNASKLMTSKQFNESIDLYQKLANNYPANRGLYESQIGANYYFLGDYIKAIEFYMSALKNGADKNMIDDNVWEATEALYEKTNNTNFFKGYTLFFPEGQYVKKANSFLKDEPKIDLSNKEIMNIVQEAEKITQSMIEWIAHPMEFGKKPDRIEIVDSRDLFCPSKKVEKCYLLKYTVDNKEYIGFITRAITWSFLQIDFSKLSFDELYLRYMGWFVTFLTINAENYNKNLEGSNQDTIIANLESKGYTDMQVITHICMAEVNYYEFRCKDVTVVTNGEEIKEYPTDHILPFYEFVGQIWRPFDLE